MEKILEKNDDNDLFNDYKRLHNQQYQNEFC